MKASTSYNLRRTLVAVVFALIATLFVIPFVYDLAGVRTNLEEQFAPTLVAERRARTRTPRTPTAQPVEAQPVQPEPAQLGAQAASIAPASVELPAALNGIALEKVIALSSSTREHIRDIYALGQTLGRNPRRISKIGDSTMVYPPFLAAFDRNTYALGKFSYLQRTIEYHAGSFARTSAAVKIGMHTWSQFDPQWVVPELCAPGEGPLACELRLNNPSIAIIRLGANDTEYPTLFEKNLGAIIRYCLQRGIIPVLGTKPDRFEGQTNLINNLIRRTASAYSVPLWDYDLIAGTVPGRGLEPDGLHMRGGGTRNFGLAAAMQSGDSLEDLTALMVLDAIHREIGAAP